MALSIFVTTPPAQYITRWPKSKRRTKKAKTNCRLNPQATVRQRILPLSVENNHAAESTARIPRTPVNRPKARSFRTSYQLFSVVSKPDSIWSDEAKKRNAEPRADN